MHKSNLCALYLRSSKDRHDVSIDAQRRELSALAATKSLAVAAEYADAVERADDWQRPGFVELLRSLNDSGRAWSTLLVMDSARIARDDEYLGAYFRNECRKRDVRILYGKLPSINPMSDLIMQTVDQLMSRIHSMTSREKGIAGQRENVHRGYRAGGRAPYGYRLERIPTGASRDGAPVTKSRLVPSDQAPAIAAYLKGRAAGRPRTVLVRELELEISPTSLIGVERNALTYAGATVWNRTRQKGGNGAELRERSKWIVQPGTHAALITQEEAEQVLARVDASRQLRTRGARYLLSGLLVTPRGARWHGDDGLYRAGRKSVKAEALERAVLERLTVDLQSDRWIRALLDRARQASRPAARETALRALQRQIRELEQKAARIRSAVAEMKHPGGMLKMLDETEGERLELERQAAAIAGELAGSKILTMITAEHLRQVLRTLAGGLEAVDREQLKARIRRLVEAVTLDPERLSCSIQYAIPLAGRDIVASPRGPEVNPTLPAAVLRARAPVDLLSGSRQRLKRAA